MRSDLDAAEVPRVLSSRKELIRRGMTERGIRGALASGELRRIRHNCYIEGALWEALWGGSRLRVRVRAAVDEMDGGPGVVSHLSAAAHWGLPLYGPPPVDVEFTMPGGRRASRTRGIVRHLDRLDDADVVAISGVRCTALARTVADVARTRSAATALACADAALRLAAGSEPDAGADAAERLRGEILGILAERSGWRGIRAARRIAMMADGRAQGPGESVSRLRLSELGFAVPDLQVEVPAPNGRSYFLDFGIDDVGVFGEFDGEVKYRDESLRTGRTAEEVVIEEKRREDWIRGVTGRRIVRWGMADIATAEALRARLDRFGVRPHL